VFKPRIQCQTFWNAGDTPSRILEIIAPGGFEGMFTDMGEWTQPSALEEVIAPNAQNGLDEEFESIGRLCERFGLTFPTGGEGPPG